MVKKENESLDVNAKTVEEAIEAGLIQLGVSRQHVDIEILSEGKRGLFGLGAEEATVRLTLKSKDTAIEAEGQSSAGAEPVTAETPAPIDSSDVSSTPETAVAVESESTQSGEDDLITEIATRHLENLLKRMGIKARIASRTGIDLVEPDETPPLVLDITGKDLGILIGRRSETLQALQYMVRLMVSKEIERWPHLVIDVESYRARRRESLHQMAKRMAERAVNNNERVVLEAMTAYERRIVHIALRDHPKVYTKSVGRDGNRKVTIIPK